MNPRLRRASSLGLLLALALGPSPPAHAADDLNRLGWLAGHWISTENGRAEEVWLAPRGGSMVGSFRWVFPNGKQVLEYLVIEADGPDVWLRFKHFNVDYVPWEKGAPNTYRLVEAVSTPPGGRVLFEYQGDSDRVPQTLQYVRSEDRLVFTGTGEDDEEPLRLTFMLQEPAD